MFQFTGDPNRSRNSGRDTLAWVREVQERGAGEIVLNCMTSDGVRRGYDVAQLQGRARDLRRAAGGLRRRRRARTLRRRVREGAGVDAALAASVFHCRHDRHSAISRPRWPRAGIEVRL